MEEKNTDTVSGESPNMHPEMDKIYSETTAVLFSKDMKLFTLREDIKDKSILVIPFEMKIPIGFPTSCKKNIDLQNQISLIFKRNQMLSPQLTIDQNGKAIHVEIASPTKSQNGEFIKLNHKLIAYFITLDEIREIKR